MLGSLPTISLFIDLQFIKKSLGGKFKGSKIILEGALEIHIFIQIHGDLWIWFHKLIKDRLHVWKRF